jgi:hypothetical protein
MVLALIMDAKSATTNDVRRSDTRVDAQGDVRVAEFVAVAEGCRC